MKHRILTSSFFVPTVAFALACVPLLAHHGSTAYETTKVLTFKDAMVTKVLWANPHVIIVFDAKDDKGNVEHWNAEAGTPSTLKLSGWSQNSVQAGDVITVYIYQSKTGNKVGRLSKIVLSDGTELKDSALGYKDN
jgi:Family of unknown function (DUF6152)